MSDPKPANHRENGLPVNALRPVTVSRPSVPPALTTKPLTLGQPVNQIRPVGSGKKGN